MTDAVEVGVVAVVVAEVVDVTVQAVANAHIAPRTLLALTIYQQDASKFT